MKNVSLSLKYLFTIAVSTILSISISAQNTNGIWSDISESDIPETGTRIIKPTRFRTVSLDLDALDEILFTAPIEVIGQRPNSNVTLRIPNPEGGLTEFKVYYSPIMEEPLANMFPEIRTYGGYDEEGNYARLDHTPQGFHAMVIPKEGDSWFIDPYRFGNINPEHYIVYKKKHHARVIEETLQCLTNTDARLDEEDIYGNGARYGDCQHRNYRLAISATGEYTAFHGGTVALAQAAQVTTMNRVNGVFELELSIRMTFIANNNLIIYTNAATDPFSNGNTGAMINENQTNTDAVIGAANYDIGHIFGTNSGGLAQLFSPCSGNKARGVTGSGAPIGDPFDIDYVAHEMGHQFGAQHTQNNNCNRSNATSMEPGSAATIMGYAGICAPNVQNNSDDYYHAISLQEMGNFITNASHTCPVTTALANNPPSVTGTPGNITVPGSTPFALTATANDPDGGSTLFCWEQMDATVAPMPPAPTNTGGPNFRSFDPTTEPTRYFPNLSDLASGAATTWEVLSSVNRSMPFRVSVRDYEPGGGCTDHDDITVSVDASSGPFVVLVPSNTGISWAGNTNETVTWSVAGTNAGAVACSDVNIFLSTDGGLTYPTQLATNVSNDGSHTVTVPNVSTTTARIMVMCANGTFFDVSDNDFTITAATFDYTLGVVSSSESACQPNDVVYNLNIGSIGGYSDPVTLSVSGVPSGATATFGTSPINPGNTTTLTISNTGGATPGVYGLTLQGNSTSGTKTESLTLTINAGTPAATTNSTPANGASNVAVPTTLTWLASASNPVTYTVDVATDVGFSSIVQTTSNINTTSLEVSGLSTNTTYYWRVRVDNACSSSAYSPTFSFTTNNCGTFTSTNVPITISATGTPTVTSTLNIGTAGAITDLNILNLDIPHTYVSDLTITLTSPSGTVVTLIDGICGSTNNINLNLDDAGVAHASIPCPPVGGGTYQANESLSAFNGEDQQGNWTLTVSDGFGADGGSIDGWSLEICSISNDYTLTVPTTNASECAGTNATYTVDVGSVGGYTDLVTLSVAGLPSGSTGSFSTNPVTPGNSTTLTISNTAGVTPGSTTFTLNATSTSGNQAENLTIEVLTATPGLATLSSPSNGAASVSTTPAISWSPSSTTGVTYTVQVATDASFSSIVLNTSGIASTSLNLSGLSTNTQYFWRVKTDYNCGSSAFTSAFNFTTGNCTSYASSNVPVTISNSGTPTVTSTVTIPISGTITDVNILNLDIPHTWVNDLTITLTSPDGTTVTLIDQICNGENNFDISLDDAGTAHASIPCPPADGNTYQPDSPLSVFDGEDPAGTWTLTVTDNANQDGGSIEGWTLEICADPPCTDAGTPSLSLAANPICPGASTTLTVSGSLNDATAWEVYTATNGGGTNLGSTTSALSVSATGATTFYVRGEGGCTFPGPESTITLNGVDSTDPTIACPSNALVVADNLCNVSLADYTGSATANDDCDASPTVTQWPAAATILSGHGTVQTVTLTATDASSNSSSCSFTVTLDDDTPPNAICQNRTVTLDGSGTITVPASNINNLSTDNCGIASYTLSPSTFDCSDIGPQTVTLTVTDAAGNSDNCTATVTVNANSSDIASFDNASQSFCQNETSAALAISGTGSTGGSYSSTPSGLSINPSTGVVNFNASSLNTYTVTYTTSGPCGLTTSTSLSVTSSDDASFSYGQPAYCETDADPTPTITGLSGGSFSFSPPGLNINSGTGQIDLSASTVGTYSVIYTTNGACSNSSTVSVTINSSDDASFSYASTNYCVNDSDPTPTITGLSGGAFSATPSGLSVNPSSGVIELSASAANTYNVTYTTSGSCPQSSSVSVTINPLPAQPSAIAGLNPACPNSSQTYTITPVTGATSYVWTLPTGWSGSSTSTSINASTSTTGGTISVAAVNGCGQSASPQSLAVSIISIDDGIPCTIDACNPANGTVTHTPDNSVCDDGLWCNGQETCDVLLGCQAGTPPTIDDGNSCTDDSCDEINDQVLNVNNNDPCDDGDPFTINDQCINGICVGTPIGNVWTGNVNNIWGVAGNWSMFIPSSADDAIIPTTPIGGIFPVIPSGYIADVNNVEVQNGATITIQSGGTLDVFGILNNNGNIQVNDSGSLLQRVGSTLAGSGSYQVQRQGNTWSNFDYWSSPIVNQTGIPGTSYSYNSNTSTQDDSDDSPSDPGWSSYNGIMIQGVGYASAGGGLATFNGTVGNGPIAVPLAYHPFDNTYTQVAPGTPFNLVGNPYPSAISAAQFISDNPGIDGTLSFWDDDLSGGTGYSRTDYAYWNGTGGLGTGPGTIGAPNGFISTAQGFMVRALGSGVTLNFNNGQRVAGSNNQFFRMSGSDSRLWFSIERDSLFNQILIGMLEDATFSEDRLYDAVKMRTGNQISISAVANQTEHAILAFPPPVSTYTVPLYVSVQEDGFYDFRANIMENFNDYQVVFNDTETNLNVPLQEGSNINVYLNEGLYEDRFFLNFTQSTITEIEDASRINLQAFMSNGNLNLSLEGTDELDAQFDLLDISGRVVFSKELTRLQQGNNPFQISNLSAGIYVVRVKNQETSFTQKVVLD